MSNGTLFLCKSFSQRISDSPSFPLDIFPALASDSLTLAFLMFPPFRIPYHPRLRSSSSFIYIYTLPHLTFHLEQKLGEMNNQPAPAGRQWLRLASLARLEALGQSPPPAAQRNALPLRQTPTQPPRPPTTTAANGSPPPPPQLATSLADSSKPSPPPPPSLWAPSRSPTPPESPRVIKSANPQESPRVGQLRPIKAPPPQNPEPELKQQAVAPSPMSVVIQQQVNNSNGSSIKTLTDVNGKTNSMLAQHGNNNGGVKTIAGINGKTPVNGNQTKTNNGRAPPPSSPKRETTKNEIGMATPQEDDHNGEMKSITMAGENVGAYMDMRSPYGYQHHSIRKQQQQHGYHDHRQTEGGGESQSEEGGESKENKKKYEEKSVATEGKPMASLVNSNVQSVNNSILFGTSCTQQSPGVHVFRVGHQQPKHKETI